MSCIPYTHKRGMSFDMAGAIELEDGETIIDFSNWVGSAQIRTVSGDLVTALDFEWLDVAQRLVRVSKLNTATWPVGLAEIDVKFTNQADSTVLLSMTQPILIEREVTRG